MFKTMHEVEVFFEQRKNHGIKPGLSRVNQLLEGVDHPEKKVAAIHVAGTNGKGSTIHYLKNALIHNNYKVGVFSSPSLDGLIGHIDYNNTPIPEMEFIHLLNEMYPVIILLDDANNHPTEFEIITVLAFLYFAEHVEIAIIEAGMGGRQDTTNCFKPILSIITNVDKEHTHFLGQEITDIAHQKAGIIKNRVPVIIGDVQLAAEAVIRQEAINNDAQLYQLQKDFIYTDIKEINDNQTFQWKGSKDEDFLMRIKMAGEHQIKNSSIAMMALVLLKKMAFTIDWNQALSGISVTKVQGRFEMIQQDPIIIVDGAHNPASMKAFLETVKITYKQKEKHLIFAAFKDKEIAVMIQQLLPYFTTITVTTFAHPRAATVEELREMIGSKAIRIESDWQQLLDRLNDNDQGTENHYFITGSLSFIGEVRRYIGRRTDVNKNRD